MNRLLAFLVFPSLLFVGCAHFARERDPLESTPVPDQFSLYPKSDVETDPWWRHFNSPELDQLMEEALTSGFTVQEAWYRLQQAEATAVRARAALFPDLSLGGNARLTERQETGESSPSAALSEAPGTSRSSEFYSLSLASSYELDLWGRVRSSSRAAAFDAEASRDDFQTAAITLSALVAETWVQLVAQREQLALLEHQIETNEKVLELLRLRFRNSLSSAIDVYQQEQVLAEVEAAVPLVRSLEATLGMELAVLLGRLPHGLNVFTTTLPSPDAMPSLGVPADLLANRPDIRSAGSRLRAADQRVAAARADRLPAIRLTADVGYDAVESGALFDDWAANLAGNLVAPLFDAGLRGAEVTRTKALADERLTAYRRTVYDAIREVESSLVREKEQAEHVRAVKRQLELAERAFDEAQNRYRNGITDYLPVLTQILAVQRLERDLISRQADQYLIRVALCRALGGTWMDAVRVQPIAQGYDD